MTAPKRPIMLLALLLLLGGIAIAVAQVVAPTRAIGSDGGDGLHAAYRIDDFGAAGDGRTDDAAAFQRALDRCTKDGGGRIALGPKRYLIATTIHLTGGCVIAAPFWPGLQQGTGDYARLAYAIILDPSATIDNATGNEVNQGLENLLIFARGQYVAGPPASYRAALTAIARYAGTAVTLVGGQDFLLRNVTMIGFATCVRIGYNQRPAFDHVYGDCTDGIVADHVYDVTKWRDLQMFPALLNYGDALPKGTPGDVAIAFAGVSVVDGRYCLTGVAASPHVTPQTGDTIYVTGVRGAPGANGRFTIATGRRGCGGVMLAESAPALAIRASVTAGDPWVALGPRPGPWVFWKGQTVRDDAGLIPAGTTIDAIWVGKRLIHLSRAPTGTAARDVLTIADAAPTSGGTLYYTLGKRSGVGYRVTNATGISCWNCFEYGYATGFHVGDGAVGVNFTGGGADNLNLVGDPTSVGVLIDGTASAVEFIGLGVNSEGRAVVVENAGSGNASPNLFLGGQYATTLVPGGEFGASFELDSAWANQLAHLAIAGDIRIADAVTSVQYAGIFGPFARPVFEGGAALARTRQDGTSLFAADASAAGSAARATLPNGTVAHALDGAVRAGGIAPPALPAATVLRMGTTTVAGLAANDPHPGTGDRAMVSDAAACAFAAPVTGGGNMRCPVVYDGSAWVGG